ncbi:MAG: ABC transporter ATP-binding protein [Oscillospiraceae bacterium]|nr:ABC transporter ATP-binding protein [Oscillospiraceae bacterium]
MKKIYPYIKPFIGYILLTLLIKVAASMADLIIPYLMESILSVGAEAGNASKVYLYGSLMALCAILGLCFNVLANRMSAVSAGKITKSIRHDLFKKTMHFSARQMDAVTVSSAESRLTSDTYNINQILARVQRIGIRAPILLVGGIAMMLIIDAGLALIPIALLPIIALITYFVTKHSIPLYTKQQTILDRVVRTVQENITGVRVIKALSKTEHEKERFNVVNSELNDVGEKAGTITAITMPASSLVLNLGLTIVVILGAIRVRGGHTEPSVIVAFLQYFTLILNAMMGVTRIFVMWSKAEASAQRVAEVLQLPEDQPLQDVENIEHSPAHIEFKDVTFSYTGCGENISHLSFRLEKGQTLGILGSTGSGKSTILNLLMRLYDVNDGQILLNGQDIRSIEPAQLTSKFGIVFQNDFIAEGDIAHNIRFFRDIPDEKLTIAAQHAQAESILAEKEAGLSSAVAIRGNNLSGGQKQRLLIARALAGDPEILVLDDASSALDYQTDALLRKALRENYRNTTTVLVAQRVSSLRHADLILVLSDGQVIGCGTHNDLMDSCEEYRIIAHTQMGAEGVQV